MALVARPLLACFAKEVAFGDVGVVEGAPVLWEHCWPVCVSVCAVNSRVKTTRSKDAIVESDEDVRKSRTHKKGRANKKRPRNVRGGKRKKEKRKKERKEKDERNGGDEPVRNAAKSSKDINGRAIELVVGVDCWNE